MTNEREESMFKKEEKKILEERRAERGAEFGSPSIIVKKSLLDDMLTCVHHHQQLRNKIGLPVGDEDEQMAFLEDDLIFLTTGKRPVYSIDYPRGSMFAYGTLAYPKSLKYQ